MMNLLESVLGNYRGPRGPNPKDLFHNRGNVERRLIGKLWNIPFQDIEAFLQNERTQLHTTHEVSVPESQAFIGFNNSKNHAEIVFAHDAAMTERCYRVLYRILITTGTFPFPTPPNTALNTDVFMTAVGILRDGEQHVLSIPGYFLRQSVEEQHCKKKRQRGAREQLRALFQTLATSNTSRSFGQNNSMSSAVPDPNEDLLDTLAVVMDLDDEFKRRWYPEDFNETIAMLPSSRSDRLLDCTILWESLECLLRILWLSMRQAATTSTSTLERSNREYGSVEAATGRLMQCFRNHEEATSEGITWPGFYETMESQGLTHNPEAEDVCRTYGRCSQPHALKMLNACILRICESIRQEYMVG